MPSSLKPGWGQSLWNLKHRLSLLYPVKRPSPSVHQAWKDFILNYADRLPCKDPCSKNFKKEFDIAGGMPALLAAAQSRQQAALYVLSMHNSVNERLGRKPWTLQNLLGNVPAGVSMPMTLVPTDDTSILSPTPASWQDLANDPLWDAIFAVAFGHPETADSTQQRETVTWFRALFTLLEACDPQRWAKLQEAYATMGSAAPGADLLNAVNQQCCLVNFFRTWRNSVLHKAGLPSITKEDIEETYCNMQACEANSLDALMNDENLVMEEPRSPTTATQKGPVQPRKRNRLNGTGKKSKSIDTAIQGLIRPMTPETLQNHGESKWARNKPLYIFLITLSTGTLLTLMILLIIGNGRRIRRHQEALFKDHQQGNTDPAQQPWYPRSSPRNQPPMQHRQPPPATTPPMVMAR